MKNFDILKNRFLQLYLLMLGLNLLFFPYFNKFPYFEGISQNFIGVAENLVEGKGFVERVFDGKEYFYQPAIWQPPVYTLFVAFSFLLFGKNLLYLKLLQIFIISLTAPLAYHFTRKHLPENYALLYGVLIATYLPLIRMSSTILSEVLFGFILFVATMLALEKRYFLTGLVLGVGCLTRDFGVVFIPAFIIYFLFFTESNKKQAIKKTTIFVIALLIVIFPWMLRNYYHYGHFVISAPKIGISMWEGIGEYDVENRFNAPWTDEELIKSENATSFLYPDPFERDKKRTELALNAIKQDPVWYFTVMLMRVPQLIFMNVESNELTTFAKNALYSFDLKKLVFGLPPLFFNSSENFLLLVMWTQQIILYALAIYGAFFILKQRKSKYYIMILIVLTVLTNIIHHVEPRYFLPAYYPILFLSCYGLINSRLFGKIKSQLDQFRTHILNVLQ